jgi:Tol biopolymer transport system component
MTSLARLGIIVLLVLAVAACSFEESGEPHEGTPAISRDGRIAFTSRGAIHVARHGTAARTVTDPGKDESDGSPDWSPDGSRIVFTRSDESVFDPWGTLHVVNADRSGLRRLTVGRAPSWSPDGEKIAFELFGLKARVYTIEVDGTNKRLLLRDAWDPAWSPDGSKIAFAQGSGKAIAVLDLKTKRVKQVVRSKPGSASEPAWSPDGTQIVFTDTPSDFPEIYVVNADGAGLRRLTRNTETDQSPTWTRDGRIIFAHSPDDGPQRLYVMNSDGSGVRRVRLGR